MCPVHDACRAWEEAETALMVICERKGYGRYSYGNDPELCRAGREVERLKQAYWRAVADHRHGRNDPA